MTVCEFMNVIHVVRLCLCVSMRVCVSAFHLAASTAMALAPQQPRSTKPHHTLHWTAPVANQVMGKSGGEGIGPACVPIFR